MSNVVIDRELTTLESEKKMSEIAIKAHQNSIAAQLRGSMGKDIDDTLSGRKENKNKFLDKLDKFLKLFG